MSLRFHDHGAFHRAAAVTVLGSSIAGAAATPLGAAAPLVGGTIGLLAGATVAYGRAWPRVIAGCLALVALSFSTGWGGLSLAAAPLALGLSVGMPTRRAWLGALLVVSVALCLLLAMWAGLRIATARETATWPSWLLAGAASAAVGLVGMLGALARHGSLVADPLAAAIKRLPSTLDPEMKQLCDRALSIWRGSEQQRLDESQRELVRDAVVETLAIASASATHAHRGPSDADLAQRTSELDAKLAGTADPDAKAQYLAARAALDDQRRYREQLATGRERLIARMHHHIATLEKFQLAATVSPAAPTPAPM